MLKYAASGYFGNHQQISSSTGIPTGSSSGKVPAILNYCKGMGLIKIVDSVNLAIKKPELTPYGRIVMLEDPFLKYSITQWLCHLNLCNPATGADVWYHTFLNGASTLGNSFPRDRLEAYLGAVYGTSKFNFIGPLIAMYEDDASFQLCGALSSTRAVITRHLAPIHSELIRGYGAWLLQLCTEYFPDQKQISIEELNEVTGWITLAGWEKTSVNKVLNLLEQKNIINVERHMTPWLIQPVENLANAWKNIYYDII